MNVHEVKDINTSSGGADMDQKQTSGYLDKNLKIPQYFKNI